MRDSRSHPESHWAADREPILGKLDSGAHDWLNSIEHLTSAMESVLAAIQERVDRLEEDLRNLRSQNSNRS